MILTVRLLKERHQIAESKILGVFKIQLGKCSAAFRGTNESWFDGRLSSMMKRADTVISISAFLSILAPAENQ